MFNFWIWNGQWSHRNFLTDNWYVSQWQWKTVNAQSLVSSQYINACVEYCIINYYCILRKPENHRELTCCRETRFICQSVADKFFLSKKLIIFQWFPKICSGISLGNSQWECLKAYKKRIHQRVLLDHKLELEWNRLS